MAYDYIISERLDRVALVTLNRPDKLNALSFPLMQELDDALTGYEADDVLAGARFLRDEAKATSIATLVFAWAAAAS